MATAYEVVRKFPNLQFILDHCGLPYEKDDTAKKLWKQGIIMVYEPVVKLLIGMAQLGCCDNLTVKLSGGFMTDAQWTQSSAVELVKETVRLFTPQRY